MSQENTATITCAAPGDLTSTTAAGFKESLDSCILSAKTRNPGWSTLELDLRAARFIDSVGINLLVLIIRMLKERGSKMRILISNKNLKRVLTFTRLTEYAEVVLDTET